MSEYISVSQFAVLHGMDVGNVRRMIASDRIPAVKIGNQWAIPNDAQKPADKRVTDGKYKDWRKTENKPE